MAHFAELDENNVVKRVIVVDNSDLLDADGKEQEAIGIAFCEKNFGGRWVQTSYNGKFRKHYAGAGMIYNEEFDCFHFPKPFPSWTFVSEYATWLPPVPEPDPAGGLDIKTMQPFKHKWNEEKQEWEKILLPKH